MAKVQEKRTPGRSAGLTRLRIVEVASGMDPHILSMQAVAKKLGVDPKALNHHVIDRSTLLGLVAERKIALNLAKVRIDATANWMEACRAFALGFAEAIMTTGAQVQHVQHRATLGTLSLDMVEAVLSKLVEAGFDDEAAVRGIVLLTNVCYSHARDLDAARSNRANTRGNQLAGALELQSPGAYPHLSRIRASTVNTYDAGQLRFSIDACIAGLENWLMKSPGSSKNAGSGALNNNTDL